MRRRYADCLSEYLTAGYHTRQLHNGYSSCVQGLEQAVGAGVLCLGALEVMQNAGFTVGMLVAFQMFASRLAQPVTRIAALWQEFQQASIAVRRLADLMDAPREPVAVSDERARGDHASLEVESLRFRHSEALPELFNALSFRLEPGQCAAITGASGCGKSTLARLLQGIYPPSGGRIRINGHDLRSLPVNEVRALMGVVPQETRLFSGTIHDNLMLGSADASFAEVVQACRLAEIHQTIEALPEGYRTRIGEQGVGLSGGQRQRIAIARALLRKPRILVFDEPTSQLDRETADALLATLNRLRGHVSVIVVAHDVPAILQVDVHVPLGQGRSHGHD